MTGPVGAYPAQPPGGYPTAPQSAYDPTVPTGYVASTPPAGSTAQPDVDSVSVGDLIGNVTRDLSTLMRQELALAQAELKQEATTTGKAAGALGASGLAGWFVVLFLSLALWAGLSNVMNAGWAALIVALVWAVIAAALFVTGRAKLRQVHPKPERTIDTLSQVPEALKGQRGEAR